jgi:hypothetical protein
MPSDRLLPRLWPMKGLEKVPLIGVGHVACSNKSHTVAVVGRHYVPLVPVLVPHDIARLKPAHLFFSHIVPILLPMPEPR